MAIDLSGIETLAIETAEKAALAFLESPAGQAFLTNVINGAITVAAAKIQEAIQGALANAKPAGT